MLKRVLILGLFALGLGGPVLAQQQLQDAEAARALGKQQFAEVVRIYASSDPAQLDDRALYRLAIAEFRLGKQALAAAYLDRALKLNPKGTFASSPERLRAWQKDIGPVAPAATPAQEVVAAAAPQVAPAVSMPVPVVPPETAAAASEPVKPPAATEAVTPAIVAAVQPQAPQRADSEGWGESIIERGIVANTDIDGQKLLFMVIAGAALLAQMALIVKWIHDGKAARLARQERQQHRKLFERLQEFRVEAGQLHGAVQAAGRTDSDLHAALSVLLKALDGEIGRSCYYGNGREDLLVPADAETLDVIQRLRSGPLKLSSATGGQVKALFQTSHRAI